MLCNFTILSDHNFILRSLWKHYKHKYRQYICRIWNSHNMYNRLQVRALGVASACWMVKEDDLGHNMAHSSSIHVHNSRLWEATIQELVPHHVLDVHYMDWITQLCSSVDDYYNRWVIILIWSLNAKNKSSNIKIICERYLIKFYINMTLLIPNRPILLEKMNYLWHTALAI